MKIPGPDHPINLSAAPGPVEALFEGHLIARSEDVLMLSEASYPPVAYFPRVDVEMAVFAKTDHKTHCPYKGEASYFSLERDGRIVENVAWSYEEPYPAMAAIKGRLAFYANVVSLKTEAGARASIDEAVRHTDSGAGLSQASPWPPTVKTPGP
jgi:uncharacterized protein (DUF427 family)